MVVQADEGVSRAIWAVPLGLALGGVGLIWQLSKRWRVQGRKDEDEEVDSESRDEYDDLLDAELKDLE